MRTIFRQLFDKTSSTYSYLLADLENQQGILIDSVQEQFSRDISLIKQFDLTRIFLISTHIHADHITGNALIKEAMGSAHRAPSVLSRYYKNAKADILLEDADTLKVSLLGRLEAIHTPGHTSGCICLVDHENRRVFTGDTLLVRGCGRTDFQGGSAEKLYDSVHQKLYQLPRDYLVYPAHDYNGHTVSSIGEEMDFNPRLTKSKSEFVKIMDSLNLAYPKLIDTAVPRNLNCGFGDRL